MAVKIRLKRIGAKKAPVYRIVVMDARQPRDGRVIDNLGRYNPRTNPITLELNKEGVEKWLAVGAIPTAVVVRLMSYAGIEKAAQAKPKKKATPKAKKEEKTEEYPKAEEEE